MAYVKHEPTNFGQMPLFIPVIILHSTKETMEQMLSRHDFFVKYTPAWKRKKGA